MEQQLYFFFLSRFLLFNRKIVMGANNSHPIPPSLGEEEASTYSSDADKNNDRTEGADAPIFPTPTGNEYDAIDRLQAELPPMIDEESQQQVDDYKEACNGGKGPMVRTCMQTSK